VVTVIICFWDWFHLMMLTCRILCQRVITVKKMRAFWDIEPCSLTDTYWRFRGVYYLHHQGIGLLQQDYMALYPKRLSSSCLPLWEPEISDYPSVWMKGMKKPQSGQAVSWLINEPS
jgi:hypothetical protein